MRVPESADDTEQAAAVMVRRVRIGRSVAVLVVAAMLRDPAKHRTLHGHGAEGRKNEANDRVRFEAFVREVSVKSDPSDAHVRVFDKKGVEVTTQQTPAILSLKRGGTYSTAKYRVVIEKEGYQPAEVTVKSTINGWYFGNLLFGGLIGMLIVDPATGAMWTLTPKDVSTVLQKQTANVQIEDGGFFVMLRKDVPAQFAGRLVQLPPQ